MRLFRTFAIPAALLLLGACYAPSVKMPSYEPRPVAIPAECDALAQRAAAAGAAQLTEADFRMLTFCQHQQLIRAQEEEAAARKLDAHARTAGLALQAATLVLGATIAVITWVF
ncbi:MAG TPA: hypothetical protein VF710_06500 [Longimicrobium sp.]|jgi:hypothetical protein